MIFKPIGDKSRRAIALDLFMEHEVGETVTYEELEERLDVGDRALIQAAVGAAKKELIRSEGRAVEAVPNVGYRIVEASDHLRLAKDRQARASKELVKSRELVVHVDYNSLSPVEQKLAEAMAFMLSQQSDFMRRYDIRHRNLERALDAITVEVAETRDGQDEIRDRLAAIEAKLGGEQT